MTNAKGAAAMRHEFDHAFTRPQDAAPDDEVLIGVDVAGARHAIRLTDIAGVLADRTIVAIPSSSPDVVGIVGFRGDILPVFDLAALLGYPRAPRSRWLAVAKGGDAAFAFGHLISHLRVPSASVVKANVDSNIAALVTVAGETWPVVSLGNVTASLAQRLKEQ
jgi:purine-binding chemotaxis protein CheW